MMTIPVQEQYILYYVMILISSIFITWLSIPSSIEVSPGKIQPVAIPKQGDVVFIPIPLLLWGFSSPILPVNNLLTACVIFFAIGIKDKLARMQCDTKCFIAIIASLIVIIPGNIRLHKLQDILGFYQLPYFPSVILSVLIIMFFINAFRLIDGVNSLAATTSIMLNSIVSTILIDVGQYELAAVSMVFVGGVSGFLKSSLARSKYTWLISYPYHSHAK
jgi:UDP-GlcNAc:undecaprenyl-phosphate GlcNAc-1-phosphate transferase